MVERQNRRIKSLEKLRQTHIKLSTKLNEVEIKMRDLQWLIDKE